MRTKYCGKIKKIHLNKRVKICGWIHKIRNLGQFIFIDLRDYTGIIQVLFELTNEVVFKKASKLKNEFCVQISGIVQERGKKNKNLKIDTGEIEILGENIKIFNSSKSLPLDYQNDNNNDDLKLKYRYLDLRRFDILENLKLRSQVKYLIKKFMTKKGFLDIETPILTKSTPEGARDYLVPSRNYFGKFYALPQSPQLFKQLLMIAGIDKYYQIVKCFRDEDLRSDRQPEFTQIDIEMSFVNSRQVQNLTEKLIKKIWLKTLGFRLNSFPKISFNRSMKKYGTDKPDLRNPIEIVDVFDFFKEKKYFSFFNLNVKEKNRIALICICKNLNQKRINYYIQYIKKNYSGQLYYIKIKNSCFGCEQTSSSIKKILNEEILKKIIKKSQAKNGSILFLMADIESIVNKSLGMLRLKIGKDLNITIENSWKPVWITNFPMFNKNINGSFSPLHHPFTAVKKNNIKKLKNSPESAISDSYDLVINGYEVGGGSVRINNACMQKKIFDIIGIKDSIQKEKFAFFLEALEYGAPPHAGIALGLDRIIMILTYSKNIREVIAFPKTTSASCLMTDSPSILDDISLKDLGIKIIKNEK